MLVALEDLLAWAPEVFLILRLEVVTARAQTQCDYLLPAAGQCSVFWTVFVIPLQTSEVHQQPQLVL